jgi:uncharacterized phiE125 gp8 family phage protein
MALVLVTDPTEEPITLDEAKHHLRVEIDDDDSLILGMIKAAREYAEAVTHRRLITQTWKYYLDEWPDESYIEIPFPPLISISNTGIKYTDSSMLVTTWTSTEWEIDTSKEPGLVHLTYGYSWPSATLNVTSPIEIEFVCGYGTPDDIPEMIKLGMKVDLTDLYENRTSYVRGTFEHLPTVERLYASHRIFSL